MRKKLYLLMLTLYLWNYSWTKLTFDKHSLPPQMSHKNHNIKIRFENIPTHIFTLLCSPTTIVSELAVCPKTQWAAVRTYRDEMSDPPHWKPPLSNIRIWNGMEWGGTSNPLMMRLIVIRFKYCLNIILTKLIVLFPTKKYLLSLQTDLLMHFHLTVIKFWFWKIYYGKNTNFHILILDRLLMKFYRY